MFRTYALLLLLVAATSQLALGLTIEEQYCGAGATQATCPMQTYNFFQQQTIDLVNPNSPVNSALFGSYAAVIDVDNAAKNNLFFFSNNNAPIDCPTARAFLFESGGDGTVLADIQLTQNTASSCLADFNLQITTTDLSKILHFVLAVSDDIKAQTSTLGLSFGSAIVGGSLPLHAWTSINTPNTITDVTTQLSIQINANAMINATCLSQAAANNGEFRFQFVKANEVIDPACKYQTTGIVINNNDNTVFMEKSLTQTEYWSCAKEVTYVNNRLTFLMQVKPDFVGCTYYEHPSYDDYLYNIYIDYIFVQGPFGMFVERVRSTEDA